MEMKSIGRAISRMVARPLETGVRTLPPGVTIAIPNWNHEFVLPRSVRSALRASHALRSHGVETEILVVDDCSRDGSPMLLRQFEALYYADGMRVHTLTRNVGLPAARNTALLHATYRHIVFMDADNELLPTNLHTFYRAMLQTGAAVVYGNLVWQGRDSEQQAMMSNESFQDRIIAENYIDAFALFDKTQLLDAGGYANDLAVEAREDWELYLHLATNGRRVIFVPLLFGIYHDLAGSMIQDAVEGHSAQRAHMRRVFDQLGVRERLPLTTRHLRYHPDIGYL